MTTFAHAINKLDMKRIVTMMAMASISLMTMAQDGLRSGLDVTDFNTTVSPGDDFYEYACGGWMKKNPLPAAYSRYGSFDRLQDVVVPACTSSSLPQ